MEKYNAINIAEYIVKKCDDLGEEVTNLKLQKILFFIQKENIKKKGRGLFYNTIEAWQYGPVVPDVYYEYSGFGAMPIKYYSLFDTNFQIEHKDKELIDTVIVSKINVDPWNLVNETHVLNGAWDCVSKAKGYYSHINYSDIKGEINRGL